jgi:hypothetical protein
MATQWEELEKLSKDELIIELVRKDWQMRNLRKVLIGVADNMGNDSLFEPGERPPEEWGSQDRRPRVQGRPADLQDRGVDEETADRLYDERFDAEGNRKS